MKIFKIIISIVLLAIFAFAGFLAYSYYSYTEAFNTENKPYKHYVGYIDSEKALLTDEFDLCDEGRIYHTYSSASLKAYKGSKKRFRDHIQTSFNDNTFTDSGYLNFRFFVNCEGNAGMFEIIQMDLDLKESPLNPQLVDSLFTLTSNPENWEIIEYYEAPRNYYMYISYRIENGKVTEIIP
ncbi:hypothetical protein [Kordia jejudonensis]|uniref:hypothetical protein n=1 Tax=Kordia jejudonensis TaxID=1348245 RepID=UPI00069BDD4C|nr:hypothetical protein [Kordia jejudonensis]